MIISSTIQSSVQMPDGRRDVTEFHVSDTGKAWTVSYWADAGADIYAALNARADWYNSISDDELPPSQQWLLKKTIVDRLSDTELLTAAAALSSQENTRLKWGWDAAVVVDPNDQVVIGMLTALFGSTRAAAILEVA